jgi:hypothetical protein
MMISCGVRFTPLRYEEQNSVGYRSPTEGDVSHTDVCEFVFIENYPRDTAKLVKAMVDYRSLHGRSLDSLEQIEDFGFYAMEFYKNNRRTRSAGLIFGDESLNESDLVGYISCHQCRNQQGRENLSRDLWRIKVKINMNNSESFEYLGRNFKTYTIRDDCDFDTQKLIP